MGLFIPQLQDPSQELHPLPEELFCLLQTGDGVALLVDNAGVLGNGNMSHANPIIVYPPLGNLLSTGDHKIEERRRKISRYRKKKTKRNFGRKIKYACRKALADSQPRIRGRFARVEECEASK
ncbi:hypothetical protein Taro_039520 [Colocasia esculenta]|uniref:CCT domain-containing protein n=1 Tax=Colocasia esculenta TaxID=4460 RepID=A0A843WG13_COLES|nr:hypothetical protein [Colocasia esculenta]